MFRPGLVTPARRRRDPAPSAPFTVVLDPPDRVPPGLRTLALARPDPVRQHPLPPGRLTRDRFLPGPGPRLSRRVGWDRPDLVRPGPARLAALTGPWTPTPSP